MLPSSGSNHRPNLSFPVNKNNLRLSSCLQDVSACCRLDLEECDDDLRINSSIYSKPSRALESEHAGSSFLKEKGLPVISFVRKKWVQAAAGLLCLILFFSIIYIFSSYFSPKASQYYVILDCGSTSTRIYVYEWFFTYGSSHKNLPIELRSLPESLESKPSSQSNHAYNRMETEPGIDKLVHNASGLQATIKPLLQWAEKQVPKHAHKSTSLFLYATAGVRRLLDADSKWLLDGAWLILRNSSFLCHRHWVEIITGLEEAYFGWIALNYNMGKLGSSSTKETFGALDLGGSSLQVTFETKELVHDETSLNLSVGAVSHHLIAHSLSGYGLNDAFDKSVAHLLKRLSGTKQVDLSNGKVKLEHPCLQTGYKEQYICSQCAELNQEGNPQTGGRIKGKGRSGIVTELHGGPHFEECSALAKLMVDLPEWSGLSPGIDCKLKPCTLGSSLPLSRGRFYAMSGFFVVFRFFNLTSEATLDDMLHKGQEFCETPWEAAKSSVVPQPFIEQYCFRAPYIVSLLREGLQISDSQIIIGSGSITWTLGVALLEAGQALSSRMVLNSYITLHMTTNPIILVVLLFLSIGLVICTLTFIGNWMPQSQFFRRPCLPLFMHNSAETGSVVNLTSPFCFRLSSPISTGDGKAKMPLSPKIAASEKRPFGTGHISGGSSIQMQSFHPIVLQSYSSDSSGQTQFANGAGPLWSPRRSQMCLQSRRSQSKEDLNSSLAETHILKV